MSDDSWSPPQGIQQRVVCAALRADDGEIMVGIRHYSPDMVRQIQQRKDGHKFLHRRDKDQGFVDQWGRWLSREEAYYVALQNGQIVRPHARDPLPDGTGAKLFSEALY